MTDCSALKLFSGAARCVNGFPVTGACHINPMRNGAPCMKESMLTRNMFPETGKPIGLCAICRLTLSDHNVSASVDVYGRKWCVQCETEHANTDWDEVTP